MNYEQSTISGESRLYTHDRLLKVPNYLLDQSNPLCYNSTLSQELIVTLIYERQLDELTWRGTAEALRCRIALWQPDVKVGPCHILSTLSTHSTVQYSLLNI